MHGKGWRVLGYFIWMLGAGVVLDSGAAAAGGVMLAVGAGLFLLGTAHGLRRRSAP